MGFGSYDESEQKDQASDINEDEAVQVHENDHDGEVSFESDADQEELIGRLAEMRSDESDEN